MNAGDLKSDTTYSQTDVDRYVLSNNKTVPFSAPADFRDDMHRTRIAMCADVPWRVDAILPPRNTAQEEDLTGKLGSMTVD